MDTFLRETDKLMSTKLFSLFYTIEATQNYFYSIFLIQCWWTDEGGDDRMGGWTREGVCSGRSGVYFGGGISLLF